MSCAGQARRTRLGETFGGGEASPQKRWVRPVNNGYFFRFLSGLEKPDPHRANKNPGERMQLRFQKDGARSLRRWGPFWRGSPNALVEDMYSGSEASDGERQSNGHGAGEAKGAGQRKTGDRHPREHPF